MDQDEPQAPWLVHGIDWNMEQAESWLRSVSYGTCWKFEPGSTLRVIECLSKDVVSKRWERSGWIVFESVLQGAVFLRKIRPLAEELNRRNQRAKEDSTDPTDFDVPF